MSAALSTQIENFWSFDFLQSKLFWSVSCAAALFCTWKVYCNAQREKEKSLLRSAVAQHELFRQNQFTTLRKELDSSDPEVLKTREKIVRMPVPTLLRKYITQFISLILCDWLFEKDFFPMKQGLKPGTLGILECLKGGDFTATEVLEAYQWAALEAQGRTNCVCLFIEEAKEVASTLDLENSNVKSEDRPPLFGLPVSIKETIEVKGHINTAGLAYSLIEQIPCESEGFWVRQLKEMGAIPFVRTNVPTAMRTYSCSNPVYGLTAHPLDSSRTPGGSSGGEAALIACYGSAFGIGSDTSGSIRVPSHFCGIAGFKPTSRNIPIGIDRLVYKAANKKLQVAFSARSPVKALLESFPKAFWSDEHFKITPNMIPMKFQNDVYYNRERPLRIGYFYTDGICEPVPACRRAVKMAKEALEERGHVLTEIHPNYFEKLQRLFAGATCSAAGTGVYNKVVRDIADQVYVDGIYNTCAPYWLTILRKIFAPYLKGVCDAKKLSVWNSVGLTARDMQRIHVSIEELRNESFTLWKDNDLQAAICPVYVSPALKHNLPPRMLFTTALLNQYSLFDFPTGTVPVTFVTNEDCQRLKSNYIPSNPMQAEIMKDALYAQGLPVGVQVAALPCRDEMCLRVMSDIQLALR